MRRRRAIERAVWGALILVLVVCWVVPAAVAQESEVIVGMVVKSEDGLVLEADDGDYLLQGRDVSSMVGKEIEVTGVVKETEQGLVLEVKSFQEVGE